MAEEREVGTVKKILADRGFGFIERSKGDDVFVSLSDAEHAGIANLKEGDRVSFVVRERSKGPRAEALALLEADEAPRARQEASRSPARPTATTGFKFGPDYLKDGYFDDKGYLRPEVLDTTAMEAAKRLGNAGMKSAQLRRFFNKARGIEVRLGREKDFGAIKADILSFKSDVVYQVGRKVVPDEFKQFIDRNVELAVAGEKSFKEGFLQHFQSVLAYFVYYFRE
jgi:CRISPR type III-A-associated protein Csm2